METDPTHCIVRVPILFDIQCEACQHRYAFTGYIDERLPYDLFHSLQHWPHHKEREKASYWNTCHTHIKRGLNRIMKKGKYDQVNDLKPCPECQYIQSWDCEKTKHVGRDRVATGILGGMVFLLIGLGFVFDILSTGIGIFDFLLSIALPIMGLLAFFLGMMSIRTTLEDPNEDWKEERGLSQEDTPPARKPLSVSVGDIHIASPSLDVVHRYIPPDELEVQLKRLNDLRNQT